MTQSSDDLVAKVISANIEVHTRLADHYQTCEPHFRPENVQRVEERLNRVAKSVELPVEQVLDLGCGTGFMINLVKKFARRVVGVDVTQAMMDKVDRSGLAEIELINSDTGKVGVDAGAFQLVTAYSFLHHLMDLRPTFATAAKALVKGGKFYADLDPNFYFWEQIHQLNRKGDYHPLVKREVESVSFKDEEIEEKFGVSREVFNHAEYGKDMAGGFREEALREQLLEAGFQEVEFFYHWFLGEGHLINSGEADRAVLMERAAEVDAALQRAMPVSRSMYKYLGFVATR